MPQDGGLDFKTQEPISEFRPARISERFLAYLLDLAPFLAGYALCLSRLRGLSHGPGLGTRLTLIFLAVYFFYEFIGNLFGATLGKWLMGIRIVGTDGRSLGLVRSLLRALGYFISTPLFNLGFIIALFQPQSRALHDLIAGTAVVELKPKNPSESGIIFIAALALIFLIYGGFIYLSSKRPSPESAQAMARAQKALSVLGQIEEDYRARHGTYTASLKDLADASGDVDAFRDSLLQIFDPNDFALDADSTHYRIEAKLKGSDGETVSIEGPSPSAH